MGIGIGSVVCAAAILVAVGCGGDVDSDGPDPASGGAGTAAVGGTPGVGAAGGSGGVGGSATYTDLEITVVDQTQQPISGAIVVVDKPGGARVETTTDALGIAKFGYYDFAAGTIDVTAFSPGREIVTLLELGVTSSRRLRLRPVYAPSSTENVTLKFLSKPSAADPVKVAATFPSEIPSPCVDSCVVSKPSGATGKLLAIQGTVGLNALLPPIKAAVAVDVPPGTGSIDVDFSKSQTIEHFAGSFAVPSQIGGFDFTKPALQVQVTSFKSTWWASAALSTSSAPAGEQVNWEADFFRPFPDAEAVTHYEVRGQGTGTCQAWVGVSHAGYPGGGPLPVLPVPSSLVSSSDSPSLFDPIEWVPSSDRPNHISVSGLFGGKGDAAWTIWFPPERDSVTLREPPASIWEGSGMAVAQQAFVRLLFCEPDPGSCAESPCAPTLESWCVRAADSFSMVLYDVPLPK